MVVAQLDASILSVPLEDVFPVLTFAVGWMTHYLICSTGISSSIRTIGPLLRSEKVG